MTERMDEARRIGRSVAEQAMQLRREILEDCEKLRPRAQEMRSLAALDSRLMSLTAATETEPPVLLAEGDSWFHYPGADVVDLLEDIFDYEVRSAAHRGDYLEDMAYNPEQLQGLARQFERLLHQGRKPMAVLLSAGGNDVAGEEFSLLLDHATSPAPGLNEDIVRGVIDVRLREAYLTLISAITSLAEQHFGEAVPVLMHGYGYAVPDGRGFRVLGINLRGPWLRPGFRAKGYPDDPLQSRADTVRILIDRFNEMQIGLTRELEHVHHVDFRQLLPTLPDDYRPWWDNELHPERQGFLRVTEEVARILSTL